MLRHAHIIRLIPSTNTAVQNKTLHSNNNFAATWTPIFISFIRWAQWDRLANHKIRYALFGGPPRNEFCDWLNAPQINNLRRIEPITKFVARYVGPIRSHEHVRCVGISFEENADLALASSR